MVPYSTRKGFTPETISTILTRYVDRKTLRTRSHDINRIVTRERTPYLVIRVTNINRDMQHVILACATTHIMNDRQVILTGDPLSHIWQSKYIQDNFSIRTFKNKTIGMTKELVMPEAKNQIGIMKEIKPAIANHVRTSNRIRPEE